MNWLVFTGVVLGLAIASIDPPSPLTVACNERVIDAVSKDDVSPSVERSRDLGLDEFLITVSRKYESLVLAEARLTLRRGGSPVLDAYMRQFSKQQDPDRITVIALVDTGEARNTFVTFDYMKPSDPCGRIGRLEFSIQSLDDS